MEMHYIGPLLGRSARITFHEFVTECSYSINGHQRELCQLHRGW